MRIIEEAFKLTRNETGITEADIAISTGEGMQDIWVWQVPVGQSLLFDVDSSFAAYLEDSTTTECVAGTLVAIDVRDSSRQTIRYALLHTLRYAQVKNFQDKDKLVRMDIVPGAKVVAEENEWIVIKGNTLTVTLDASDSYFELKCKRVRKSPL